MPVIESEYQCRLLYRNGHVQTIHSRMFSKRPSIRPREILLETPDNDQLELYLNKQDNSRSLVIISHGLESHGKEAMLLELAQLIGLQGYDTLTWSMRSCGKQPNKTRWFYNGCDYSDLKYLIDTFSADYERIYLVGFSLGGAITANYLGREAQDCNPKVKGAFLVSPSLELNSFHHSINAPLNNLLYQRRLVKSLLGKFIQKTDSIDFGENICVERVKSAKTVEQIEEYLLAPLHGFQNAADYRSRAAALPHLGNIETPLYILAAKDDPLVDTGSLPFALARQRENIFLELTRHGGHSGFMRAKNDAFRWSERRCLWFLQQVSSQDRQTL